MLNITVDGIEYRFFNPSYAISRCGKILKRLLPFDPSPRSDGYMAAGGAGLVHRMVAFCWLEKPLHSHHVHHRDHNKTNNHADNLEWVTPQEHMRFKHPDNGRGKHIRTEATKEKLRQYRTGKKDSVEVRAKKADILRRISLRKNACEIDGVQYRSFLSASKATGIHFHTIRYRCLSKNFQNYSLVTSS